MHFSILKSMTSESPLFCQGLFSCGPETTDFIVGLHVAVPVFLFQKFILKWRVPFKVTLQVQNVILRKIAI